MSRSLWKGPVTCLNTINKLNKASIFIASLKKDHRKKVLNNLSLNKRKNKLRKQYVDNLVIKAYNRSTYILPSFVGQTFSIYNGKEFKNLFIQKNMVGRRLGEFSLTRKNVSLRGSGSRKKK